LAIGLRAGFRVTNWLGSKHARRDRALIFVTVATRLLRNGPSPVGRVFDRAWVDHRLRHRHTNHSYRFVLSAKASRFLIGRGAFSPRRRLRRRALRLITIRIEQDRDFKHVDGRYDWREGAAFSPLDRGIPAPDASDNVAHASGSGNPEGTLSVTNDTASGVYCQKECPQYESSIQRAGSLPGTLNNPTYAVPLAVSGAAAVCFEQGTGGSNPEGFDYKNPEGEPQAYAPGESLSRPSSTSDSGLFEEVPAVTGTTVTEPIIANDTIYAPSEEESALLAASASTEIKSGIIGIQTGASLTLTTIGYAFGVPSPGSIVTGILALAEFLIDRSCDGNSNLMALSAAETGGGSFSAEFDAQVQHFGFYQPPEGPASVQLNPSTISYAGSQIDLMPRIVQTTGLADNVCDCQKSTGNNAVYLEWADYEPCKGYYQFSLDCTAAAPATLRKVFSAAGGIDCGPGNTACDFPAAAGTPTPPTSPPREPIGEVTACSTNLRSGAVLEPGEAIISPNGNYSLGMLTNGTLALFKGPADAIWTSTQAQSSPGISRGPTEIGANSHAIVEGNGTVAVYQPDGRANFAIETANPGDYLALQNNGDLVLYSAAGQMLWESATVSQGTGAPCG
jgi:hypothetical protein